MQQFIRKALTYIRAAYLLLPFVFWPFGFENFETPKVTLFIIVSLLFLVISLLFYKDVLKVAFKKYLSNSFVIFYLLFLLSLLISSILGMDLIHSLYGSYTRMDGLFMHLSVFILSFGVFVVISNNSLYEKKLFKLIVYTGVFVSLFSIFKFLLTKIGVIPTEDLLFDGREVGTLG